MNGWYNQEEILDITKFGFGVRDLHSDNHWIDAPQDFSFLGKKNYSHFTGKRYKFS